MTFFNVNCDLSLKFNNVMAMCSYRYNPVEGLSEWSEQSPTIVEVMKGIDLGFDSPQSSHTRGLAERVVRGETIQQATDLIRNNCKPRAMEGKQPGSKALPFVLHCY
jgi:hypothetical protein